MHVSAHRTLAWIDHRVQQVDDETDEHKRQRNYERHALDNRVIASADRFEDVAAAV